MSTTFHPHKLKMKRTHGFRARMATLGGSYSRGGAPRGEKGLRSKWSA